MVRWYGVTRGREFNRIAFGIQTIYEIPEPQYREVVGARLVQLARKLIERNLSSISIWQILSYLTLLRFFMIQECYR